ncbi:unnamed protein product [Hymenolepis diminuta]|uniref:Uncharacterized protein n=1 Tax=Hymenolepis diminuta TaxID=6216 RepID=A0A564YU20_HYMDI|nr:unnamed protein product [Hymenolepis diminuta]
MFESAYSFVVVDAKMSPNFSSTSTTAISLNSPENSTQSPVVPVSPKVFLFQLVQVANENMRLYPSVRDIVKCPSNNQCQNPVCFITRKIKYAIRRAREKVPLELLIRPPGSNLRNVLVSATTFEPNQSSLSVLSIRTVKQMVAQSAGQAALSYHRNLICSQTDVPWSYIDLSVAGSIKGISYLNPVSSYSQWPEVITTKSATTGTVINSLRQLFVNQGVQKISPISLLLDLRNFAVV